MKNIYFIFCIYFLLQIPLYSGNCTIPNCSICDSNEKCLECMSGWFGKKCEHACLANDITCSFCSDYHNVKNISSLSICLGCREDEYFSNDGCQSCPDTCVSCVGEDNCTQCKDGFFGPACEDVCPVNCLKCSSTDVCASCRDGWSGKTCQSECSKNCLRFNRNTSGYFQHIQLAMGEFAWCDGNGTCLAGCIAGKHGRTCNADCPKKNVCLACAQFTGHCLKCTSGMYGNHNHCDKRCGHCKPDNQGVVKCDINTGECANGCLNGYYLPNCEHECGHCLQNAVNVVNCDMQTGYCENGCVDGYFGRRCDKKCGHCPPDHNGTVKCSMETGNCNNSCIDGYYGQNCDQKCKIYCFDSKRDMIRCDKLSGNCSFGCVPGLHGDTCEETCSNTCRNSSCSQQRGFCDNGCIPGWHGNTCKNACSCTCSNKSCDQQSGYCDKGCVPGWYGDRCAFTCSSTCSYKSCDQQSGYCDNGCVSGWYGDRCTFTCSSTCLNKSCDRYSGQCADGCFPGYYGSTCEFNCSKTCRGSVCEVESAKCLLGCIAGFEGAFCNYSILTPIQPDSAPFVVGFTGCLIGFAISFILILVGWLTKRVVLRGKRYGNLDISTRETVVPIYEEISEINERTEEQRTTSNHIYMEVGIAPVVRITKEAVKNAAVHCDVAGKRTDITPGDRNIVITSSNLKHESNGIDRTCIKTIGMSSLNTDNSERKNKVTDEIQISSSNALNATEVRAYSDHSRKYYEITDIQTTKVFGSEADENRDSYEVPVSSTNTRGQNGEGQSKIDCKTPDSDTDIAASSKFTASALEPNYSERCCKIDITKSDRTKNKDDNIADILGKIESPEKNSNHASFINEKIEVNTKLLIEKAESTKVDRLSNGKAELAGGNTELIKTLNKTAERESDTGNSNAYIDMGLQTTYMTDSNMESDSDSVNYLHPVS